MIWNYVCRLYNRGYHKILTTHLYNGATSIYETDLTQSMAILLGNEKKGVSKEAMQYSNGNVLIPIHGMAEILNVSVACSLIVLKLCAKGW